jgi:hypothetical protein
MVSFMYLLHNLFLNILQSFKRKEVYRKRKPSQLNGIILGFHNIIRTFKYCKLVLIWSEII